VGDHGFTTMPGMRDDAPQRTTIETRWGAGGTVERGADAGVQVAAAGPLEMTLDFYRIIPEWITGMAVVRGAPTS